jgi:hypothetical protein
MVETATAFTLTYAITLSSIIDIAIGSCHLVPASRKRSGPDPRIRFYQCAPTVWIRSGPARASCNAGVEIGQTAVVRSHCPPLRHLTASALGMQAFSSGHPAQQRPAMRDQAIVAPGSEAYRCVACIGKEYI